MPDRVYDIPSAIKTYDLEDGSRKMMVHDLAATPESSTLLLNVSDIKTFFRDSVGDLSNVIGSNGKTLFVENVGIFEWSETGEADNVISFDALDGGIWVLRIAIALGAIINIYNSDGSLTSDRVVSLNTHDIHFINGTSFFRRNTLPQFPSLLNRVIDITQTNGEYALHLGRSSATANVAANQVFFKSGNTNNTSLLVTAVGHFLGNIIFYGVNGSNTGVEAGRIFVKVERQDAGSLDVKFVFSTGLFTNGVSVLTLNGNTGGWIVGKGVTANVEAIEDPASHISFYGVNKGQKMPPMTTAERLLIPSLSDGLRVYDTDFKADMIYDFSNAIWTGFRYSVVAGKFQGYNGVTWIDLN